MNILFRSSDVKQAFGYRAGSSVYGPFGSKFGRRAQQHVPVAEVCARHRKYISYDRD
jgi:hypothetical protein